MYCDTLDVGDGSTTKWKPQRKAATERQTKELLAPVLVVGWRMLLINIIVVEDTLQLRCDFRQICG